jgi:hypothetical protein
MHGPINVKNPRLYAPSGEQLSLCGKMVKDETFLTGCLENEHVEGDIDVDVAPINARSMCFMHRSFPMANFGTDDVLSDIPSCNDLTLILLTWRKW